MPCQTFLGRSFEFLGWFSNNDSAKASIATLKWKHEKPKFTICHLLTNKVKWKSTLIRFILECKIKFAQIYIVLTILQWIIVTYGIVNCSLSIKECNQHNSGITNATYLVLCLHKRMKHITLFLRHPRDCIKTEQKKI